LDHKDIGIDTRITTYKNTRKRALGSQDIGARTLATMFKIQEFGTRTLLSNYTGRGADGSKITGIRAIGLQHSGTRH